MWTQVLLVLVVGSFFVPVHSKSSSREGRSRRRKPEPLPRRNASAVRISPDPVMTALGSAAAEVDFDKSIEDMVSQVRNNPSLSLSRCVVDRRLWMSNSRSLSPWSYRINHDAGRKPVEIPEAVCSCVGCINPFTMQEDRSMTSALIYSQIPVRRRVCPRSSGNRRRKCVHRFRTVLESVAVGCTCIVG